MLPILSMLALTAVFATAGITRAVHIPRNGDHIDRWRCEMLNPGSAGDSAVWDFSHVTVLDENQGLRYIVLGDTLLVRCEGGTMNTFLLKDDSVLWKKSENRLSFFADSIAPLQMLLPMEYADSITTPFYMTGNYCGNYALAMAGHRTVHVDGRGTLILPADTIDDVLRMHIRSEARVSVSNNLDVRPLYTASDSIMDKTEDFFLWYAPMYRFPLAEVRMSIVEASDGTCQSSGVSFLCPPLVQDYALGTHSMKVKRDDDDNNHHRSAAMINDLQDSYTDGSVTVTFTPGSNTCVSMVVTDVVGRVFVSLPKKNVATGVPFVDCIDGSILPSGVYLLHVEAAGEAQNRKFTIK